MNLLVAFAILAGVASAAFGAFEVAAFTQRLEEQKLAGRNVLLFAAAEPTNRVSIDRKSCEGVTSLPSVERAGLIERVGVSDVLQIGSRIPIIAASATLFPALNEADAVVGSVLIAGAEVGEELNLSVAGGIVHSTVGKPEPVGVDTNSALVVALEPQYESGPACLVVLDDYASADEYRAELAARLEVDGGPLAATQPFTDASNPVDDFLERSGQYLPLLLGLLGGLSSGILNRLRSGELAAYRLSGTSPRSLFVLIALEQFLLGGCMALSGSFAVVVLNAYLLSPLAAVLAQLSAGFVWIICAILTTVDLPVRQPPDLAKDRT